MNSDRSCVASTHQTNHINQREITQLASVSVHLARQRLNSMYNNIQNTFCLLLFLALTERLWCWLFDSPQNMGFGLSLNQIKHSVLHDLSEKMAIIISLAEEHCNQNSFGNIIPLFFIIVDTSCFFSYSVCNVLCS